MKGAYLIGMKTQGMGGRFTQRFSWQQVHDYMNLLGAPVELTPRYNIAPG